MRRPAQIGAVVTCLVALLAVPGRAPAVQQNQGAEAHGAAQRRPRPCRWTP